MRGPPPDSRDDEFDLVDDTQILSRSDVPEPPVIVIRSVSVPTLFAVPELGRHVTLGRSPDADLVLSDASVSRYHARIQVDAHGLLLVDLDSTNGTFVNQARVVGSARIEPGDRIVAGAIPLSIERLAPAEVAALTRLASRLDSASRDPLTGFATRHWLHDDLPAWLERRRGVGPIACLFVDLDNLKHVNDTRGHPEGDRVLREVCDRIREVIRDDDVGIRYGGDEFVVLLGRCRAGEGVTVANRIRSAVRGHAWGSVGAVTVSIGVAELAAGESPEQWIARADRALYRAKGRRDHTEVSPGSEPG